jgi:PAS domain S-box-containing protein
MISKKALIEFFKISPTPSLVLTPDAPKFTIAEVNNAYLQATNSKREDLMGKGIFEVFPDDHSDPTADGVKNLTQSLITVVKTKKSHKMANQKYNIPIRGTSQFELRYWQPENIPLLDENGELQLIIHTAIDITESILSNKKIAESRIIIDKGNEVLQHTEAISKLGRWELDLETNVLFWSDGCYIMIGHTPQEFEMTFDKAVEIIHPDDREKAFQYFKAALETQSDYKEEIRFLTKNNSVINVVSRGKFLTDATGKPIKLVGVLQDITDIKAAEAAIEQSNERFEYVTKATFDAIWDWDLVNGTIYWGEGFEKIFGHKISQTNSASWTKNIHPDDVQKINDSIYNTIDSTEINWMEEYRFKNGDGTYSYVIDRGIIIRNGSNKAIRMIGAMQDITKRKEEEQRLKLLESVITNTNDAVLIKEAMPSSELGRKIVYVNEAFTRMSGYKPEEVIGKTHQLLHGPHTDAEELSRFYKALDEGQPSDITIVNYKKNGEEYWVNLSLNPVINAQGDCTHWISIERDVTERKNQEQKLAETSEKLWNTLESIQDGFYTLDDDWNISYWNKEAEKISGRKQEEMLGKNIWEMYEGRISKKIQSVFHDAKKLNTPIRTEVYSKNLKYWVELNAFPSTMGLTVSFKNITERKQTESQLKKMNRSLEAHVKELAISNQELEQFAYVASHDLQEPLRMITSFLTQIEKKYDAVLDEKGKKYIFFAVDGAKRMRQIILDLLGFSRIGKNDDQLEDINLNEIVDEIAVLYRKQIEETGAQIKYENLPKLRSYSAPMKQVFQNLISNALKYSKADVNPVITISSKDCTTHWKFMVTDNGIGINPEYFDKIFIIFQRLHNKDEYSGTGMGLAITKKILENLGGKIEVESEEGKGSTFCFTIPKKQIIRL